jgi:broad specificity phosphatase PhoE
MKELFSNLKKLEPVTMMIRHAERFPIFNVSSAWNALLTEKGKEDAFRYGAEAAVLSHLTIYHSPVQRCRQTAEYIVKGVGEAGGSADLGGPLEEIGGSESIGSFESIQAPLREYGISEFLRMWFDGKLIEGDIHSLEHAAAIGYGCIKEKSRAHENSVIMVSHDWNIMILREYLLHMRHEDVGYPDFLDGITYYRMGGAEKMFAHHIDFDNRIALR